MNSLIELARERNPRPLAPLPRATHFRFLDLPDKVRLRVLRHALIPPNGVIHPCLDTEVDETTKNILPVLLTCKAIHEEAEAVLYNQPLFSSCCPQYEFRMHLFHSNRTPRQRALLQHSFCSTLVAGSSCENIDPRDGGIGLQLFRHIEKHPCIPPLILLTDDDDSEIITY